MTWLMGWCGLEITVVLKFETSKVHKNIQKLDQFDDVAQLLLNFFGDCESHFRKKPMKNQAISQPLQPSHTPCDPTISLPPYRHWGLPYNMPAHSLQRSQYVNGLAELTPEIRASGEWRALSAKCGMSETCCLYINSLYWWLLVYINDY